MQFQIEARDGGLYDVIVVGAGPAGVSAAITAGRQGARVLLVEALGRVGGMSTSGIMNQFVGTVGNHLYHEICARLAEKNPFQRGVVTKHIDSELLTLTYMELLEEAQVKLLLYTSFCEPLMENGCVGGVLCHSKDGFCTFRLPWWWTARETVTWRKGRVPSMCLGVKQTGKCSLPH